jgi:hypothetical protein
VLVANPRALLQLQPALLLFPLPLQRSQPSGNAGAGRSLRWWGFGEENTPERESDSALIS